MNKDKLNPLINIILTESFDCESWREIPKTKGRYFISDYGRVISLCQNQPRILKPYICSNQGNSIGYYFVKINGKNRKISVLVANAFLQNPEDKRIVHHIDLNKHNDKLNNLMYMTDEEHALIHSKAKSI